MDWELYERLRASVVLAGMVFASALLLFFQHTSVVRDLRVLLVRTTLPIDLFLSDLRSPETLTDASADSPSAPAVVSPTWADAPEVSRRLSVMSVENARLLELLNLKEKKWPSAVAAHVTGRDPLRWFQEIVLDKGKEDGISPDDPVIAVVDNKDGLVGRVVETGTNVSRVMLIQDSLSAVASTIRNAQPEDGVVEGSNSHDLVMKYLDRSSHAKLGDLVVTSGLGDIFPEGIPIGTVLDVALDARQLFLEARIQPVVATNKIHVVLVLTKSAKREAP